MTTQQQTRIKTRPTPQERDAVDPLVTILAALVTLILEEERRAKSTA